MDGGWGTWEELNVVLAKGCYWKEAHWVTVTQSMYVLGRLGGKKSYICFSFKEFRLMKCNA